MSASNSSTTKKARALAAAAEAVRKRLGLETLETRNRDALDFHEHSAAGIRDAIALAFEAGYAAGLDAARTIAK